jgi:hypothetical protein
MKRGNRESTIERKMRYLKQLNGSPEDMMTQALNKSWTDGVKENALDVVCQYAEFLGVSVRRPNFRGYDNHEMPFSFSSYTSDFERSNEPESANSLVKMSVECS